MLQRCSLTRLPLFSCIYYSNDSVIVVILFLTWTWVFSQHVYNILIIASWFPVISSGFFLQCNNNSGSYTMAHLFWSICIWLYWLSLALHVQLGWLAVQMEDNGVKKDDEWIIALINKGNLVPMWAQSSSSRSVSASQFIGRNLNLL